MKKIVYLLFIGILLFSCSKNNDDEPKKNNLKDSYYYEVTFKQYGDTDKLSIDFLIYLSKADLFEKGTNKKIYSLQDIDLKNQKGTFKYYTSKENENFRFIFSSSTELSEDYLNDVTVKVFTSLIVKRNGKEIFNKSSIVDKDNPEESLEYDSTKY